MAETQKRGQVEILRDLVQVQSAHGNWNCNPYMMGLANGLILALSLFDGGEPKYLSAPEKWLDDLPKTSEQPTVAEPARIEP